MKIKYLAALFFAAFSFVHLNAQNQDSLEIRGMMNDAFALLYSEPNQARAIAEDALAKSKKIKDCLLEAESRNIIGIVYDVTSEYDSALMVYDRIIEISDSCGIPVMKAQVLNNIGLIHWNTGELDKAIDYYTQSLVIFEEYNKDKGVASTLSNIGLLYSEKQEYYKAADFQWRALELRKKIKDWYGVSVSYVNLANVYMGTDRDDSAKVFLKASVRIKDTLNDYRGLAINYNNLGIICYNQDKTDSAFYYLRKGIAIRRKLGEKNLEASDHYSLAYFSLDHQKYKQAYAYLDTAKTLAEETDSRSLLMKIYKRYARVDTLVGDYKGAVVHMNHYFALQQELENIEKERAFDEVQAKYETEKKERQLAENRVILAEQELTVRHRTLWAAILLGVLAVLIVTGFYMYRQAKLKEKQLAEEARLKEELARAEVNSKIQEERVRISRDLHDHVGAQLTIISSAVDNIAFTVKDAKLKDDLLDISDNGRNTMVQLRDTIWAMNQKVINLDTLVAKTREFVSRLKLDDKKVRVEVHRDKELDLSPSLAINLFRVVQEATNNAVKHADFSSLEISFEKVNGSLAISVEDDGKGFVVNQQHEKGFGLINMSERIKEFEGSVDIYSTPGEGTQVSVIVSLNGANYV